MQTHWITIAVFSAALLFTVGAHAEKRVALVIGNGAYTQISTLDNPRNDAALMAATLRDVGFDVTTVLDADLLTMNRAIRNFGKALRMSGKDAVGLFYYAGHGVQARGANHLIPLGAIIENQADLEVEAVSISTVLSQMELAGNALNLVVLDACRNNPFKGSFRSGSRGLARLQTASGTLVAFAAAPGQIAADGRDKNSPYTSALAAAIREPGLTVEKVFKRVRVRVENETGGQQTPWEESSLRGEFYFTEDTGPPSGHETNSSAEITFWTTIRNSKDVRLFETYRRQYPDGVFSELAVAMIEQLKSAEEQGRTEAERRKAEEQARAEAQRQAAEDANRRTTELAYWNSVKDSDDPALLQSYLERYPGGAFSALAEVMIERANRRLQAVRPPSPKAERLAAVAPDAATTPAEDSDLPFKLQTALTKAGCNPGKIDGEWGRNSEAALRRFARHANVVLPDEFVSAETLALFEVHTARVCPLACGKSQVEKNGRCVAKTCPGGQVLTASGACRQKARQATTTQNQAAPPPPAEAKRKRRPRLGYDTCGNVIGSQC